MSFNICSDSQPLTTAPMYQVPDNFVPTYTYSEAFPPEQPLYMTGDLPPAQANENLQSFMQVTIDTLQGIFSMASVLGYPHLQDRMNRSQWIPLEEIHNDCFYHLGVTFEFLQDCAIHKMYKIDSNFELDSTRTFIRPMWAKMSHIKFRVIHNCRVSKTVMGNTAKKILNKALESVADSQQVAFENEKVEVIIFGRDPASGSCTAYFNAPAIPSLIKSFMNEYSEGVAVTVIEIADSCFLPLEYPEQKRGAVVNSGESQEL